RALLAPLAGPPGRPRGVRKWNASAPSTHKPPRGRAKELLHDVKAKLGLVLNMTRAMAVSPPIVGAYTGFSGARATTSCWHGYGKQLALTVSEACPAYIQSGQRVGESMGVS